MRLLPSRVWTGLLLDAAQADAEAYAAFREKRTELKETVEKAAAYGGLSEYEIADLSGFTRATIRTWRGKREA